jgi:predicted nucleic acid-binding protein
MGTLGILVTAKLLGHLERVAPVLAELKANRFHFSEAVKHEVLIRVDKID